LCDVVLQSNGEAVSVFVFDVKSSSETVVSYSYFPSVTSLVRVMLHPAFAHLSVSSFMQNYISDLHENFTGDVSLAKDFQLNFGSHLHLDLLKFRRIL